MFGSAALGVLSGGGILNSLGEGYRNRDSGSVHPRKPFRNFHITLALLSTHSAALVQTVPALVLQ
jgi:hypothetical protein